MSEAEGTVPEPEEQPTPTDPPSEPAAAEAVADEPSPAAESEPSAAAEGEVQAQQLEHEGAAEVAPPGMEEEAPGAGSVPDAAEPEAQETAEPSLEAIEDAQPGAPVVTHEASEVAPEAPVNAPETPANAPEVPADAPEAPANTPADAPEEPAGTPEEPVGAPGEPVGAPGEHVGAPGGAPGEHVGAPGEPVGAVVEEPMDANWDAPEAPMDASGPPADAHEAPADGLEVQIEAPEAPTEAPKALPGPVEVAEQNTVHKPPVTKRGSSKAPSMSDIVMQQMIKVLAKNLLKLQELFRQWDANGDGSISRKEWRKACPLIGISAAAEHLDALFERFDEDGDGFISLPELQRAIRTGGKPATNTAKGASTNPSAGNKSPTKGGRGARAHGAPYGIGSSAGDDSAEEGAAQGRPRRASNAGARSHKNPFREQDLATLSEMAPLGLKVLGMAPDEWNDLRPSAAAQIGADLERKSTVFETILRSHLQDSGDGGRVWETGAPEPPPDPEQLEMQRQRELERLAALDEARRLAREEQLSRERHAISIQALARGRSERRRFKQNRPVRTWRFQKCMERTFDVAGANVARFYIESNESIEIVSVLGAGRLLLTAADAQGKQVVSSAVVFDSSAHHFNASAPKPTGKGASPPLWSAPGEHEYSFALMPLEMPLANRDDADAVPAGKMIVTFRRVMTFTEEDVVEEAQPKPPTKHLDPYRRNPRRHSHLEPIRNLATSAAVSTPSREKLAPITDRPRAPPPPPISLDSPSGASSRGATASGPALTEYQLELGERTRERAAKLEAQQMEEERKYAATHGLLSAVIPVQNDAAAASVFEQQQAIQQAAQAQQAQYMAYMAAQQQQQQQQYAVGGWSDAASVYANYMAQAYPPYGNPYGMLGMEGATGPTEPQLKALTVGKSPSSLKQRKPRTGGFGR